MLLLSFPKRNNNPSVLDLREDSGFLKELLQWLNNNDIQCDFVEEFFIFGLDRLNIITKPLIS